MSSLNKAMIIGNLGRDPEVRAFQNGDRVCNLSVGTNERWKDKQTGEQRDRTEWHRVAVFGNLVNVCEQYLRKGSKVYIEGKLKTRKWQDRDGVDRYSTEIVLQGYGGNLVLLDNKSANQGVDNSQQQYQQPQPQQQYQQQQQQRQPSAQGSDPARQNPAGQAPVNNQDINDDIPF